MAHIKETDCEFIITSKLKNGKNLIIKFESVFPFFDEDPIVWIAAFAVDDGSYICDTTTNDHNAIEILSLLRQGCKLFLKSKNPSYISFSFIPSRESIYTRLSSKIFVDWIQIKHVLKTGNLSILCTKDGSKPIVYIDGELHTYLGEFLKV